MAKKNSKITSVDSAAFAAAADQESTPNQLCALAVQSPELARIVAANPAIDASVVKLLKKQKDPKVNRALAANPGTPMADLLELGERYTSEFVQNPIFDLALAADPRFIARFTENILKKYSLKRGLLKPFFCGALAMQANLSLPASTKCMSGWQKQLQSG